MPIGDVELGLTGFLEWGFIHPMSFVADLHIHSRFSRATSRSLNAEQLAFWAAKKGISVLGSGDITHPAWIAELQEQLVEAEHGLFRLRPDLERNVLDTLPSACQRSVRFMLSSEISCIYKKGEKTRKLHHLVLLPGFEAAARFNERLDRIGNIASDGRPILGLDSRDLLEIVLETDDRAFFIPAHIWTPWFSLFGSKSGFDTLEACFEDLSPHIHALETGLSSDPPMNRLLSALDKYILVSNSDAHSASKLGREANLFETEMAYDPMIRAMTDGTGFQGTIEFYPEEGKYHLDGHRKCGVRMAPEETLEAQGLCPVCGSPVTVGVLNRVAELADRDEPVLQRPFRSLIPLPEILSELLSCGPATKKVSTAYEALLADLGPELDILMSVSVEEIETAGGPLLARAVSRMREDRVIRQGGFDGEYGVIRVFDPAEMDALTGQGVLFEPSKKARKPRSKPKVTKRRVDPDSPAEEPKKKPLLASPEDPILDPLNEEQQQAVLHRGGHLLIVAGPGTGKTLTLTHRIAHMIREGDVLPEQVLALTFTNKAAGEMGERIERLLGNPATTPCVATFHRFCLDFLRQEGPRTGIPRDFDVCSEADAAEIARKAVDEIGESGVTAARLLSRMPTLKRKELLEETPEPKDLELAPCLAAYRSMLRSQGMLDLDDLEVETLRLIREHPETCRALGVRYPCVFVDEYQDTSPFQARLLRGLFREGACLITAIGDPDQAIYGFRGADVSGFRRFSRDFPGATEVALARNYRSVRSILQGATALLDASRPLAGGTGEGEPLRMCPCATHREEAEMVVEQIEKLLGGTTYFSLDSGRVASHEGAGEFAFGDIAVLFRINAQAEAFEEAFLRAGIPFVRSGEKPLTTREPIPVLWRFLQTLCHPDNSFYREAYANLLGEDAAAVEKNIRAVQPAERLPDLVDHAVAVHDLKGDSGDALEALRRLRDLTFHFDGGLEAFVDALSLERGIDHASLVGDRVALLSFHAAKGLEWPVVFLSGLEDGIMPLTLFREADEDEEQRLLYVALTRARNLAFLSWSARRTLNGRTLELSPSRFLRRLPETLCTPVQRASWKPKRRQTQLALF
jgi:DNA helicase-2/ATP-dependent DNA helicase PcrA